MSDDFYANLPAYTQFSDALDIVNYTPVPDDWFVIISDIKGSTEAVQNGRYKDVNMLGATSIVAVLNVAPETEIPFVFGGDGATVLVPPSLLEATRAALLATQQMAAQAFGMLLRVGLAPAQTAVAAGQPIYIAKYRPSPNYEQAMFAGGGLAYIEKLIKDPATAADYNLYANAATPDGDFSGLECRWQDIPSRYGETISLLVTALADTPARNSQIYREVVEQMQTILGGPNRYRPVAFEALKATFDPRKLALEIKVQAEPGWWGRFKYLLKLWFASAFLYVTTRFDITTNDVRWLDYVAMVVETSDYRKYDDTLRMIVAGTAQQRQQLAAYLEERYQAGELAYGLHVTDRALLTCLVFERMGRQVHFVDGADGGYALAAKGLKQRLREREK